MSSCCTLFINNYPILTSNKYADPYVLTVFREEDKNIYDQFMSERNKHIYIEFDPKYEIDKKITIIEYKASAKVVRERLEIMGFTIEHVTKEFEQVRKEWILERKESVINEVKNLEFKARIEEENKVVEDLCINDFLSVWQMVIKGKICGPKGFAKISNISPKYNFIFKYEDIYTNFPVRDIRCLLRMLVEISPDDTFLIQDLTDVIEAGYYASEEESPLDIEMNSLVGDIASQKIIVLPEGSTDASILARSLKLLYPHLCSYYYFMDFGFKPAGGAGNLTNTVKSFAASGVSNRIIALFDNDAAAYHAISGLKNLSLPKNIAVHTLPNIEIAKNYPTLMSTKPLYQDVNGKACSIELYLGKDVLTNESGELTPIIWGGDSQGAINSKNKILKKFEDKLKLCEKNAENIIKSNWNELEIIFQSIFKIKWQH